MSKKSKRSRARKRNLNQRIKSNVELAKEPADTYPLMALKDVPVSSDSSKYKVLSERYQYVLPELKVISIISGIIFILLIVLSFVLK